MLESLRPQGDVPRLASQRVRERPSALRQECERSISIDLLKYVDQVPWTICEPGPLHRLHHRHSAYHLRFAMIAYSGHPFFRATTWQVSPFRRGKELTCIYTDERLTFPRVAGSVLVFG